MSTFYGEHQLMQNQTRKTALEYGMDLKSRGLKGPIPIIAVEEINYLELDLDFYKVGKRSLRNTFILVRSDYATLYVRSAYQSYRLAYKDVFKICLIGKDVDHLSPRSKAKSTDFIAVGNINSNINRLHNAKEDAASVFVKAMNHGNSHKEMLTNTPRARELGKLVVNGYLKPIDEINISKLTKTSRNEIIKKSLKRKC